MPDGGRRRLHEAARCQAGARGAALIALGSSQAPDKLLERLRPYGGDVIQTSLDSEDEERLRSALGEPVSAA